MKRELTPKVTDSIMKHVFLLAVVFQLSACAITDRPKYNTTCIDGTVHWNLKNINGDKFYIPYYNPDGSIAKCYSEETL